MEIEELQNQIDKQYRLRRALKIVGSLVVPLEDEERILDLIVQHIIETARIRSLAFSLVYSEYNYIELVRSATYSNLVDGRISPLSTLDLKRLNERTSLDDLTLTPRMVHEPDHLVIVDGNHPYIHQMPNYDPDRWEGKAAYFVRLMYRDECLAIMAGACPSQDSDTALDWIAEIDPLLDIAAAKIKTMRVLKAQRFLTYQPPQEAKLSDREREVLRLVALGESSENIATTMNLSPRTVHTYRQRICKKLDRHSLTDLTRYAIMTGLIPLTDR